MSELAPGDRAERVSRYVIWSEEHGAWWGPGKNGYTRSLAQAGRYGPEEAAEIVSAANRYVPKSLEWLEVALEDPL